VNAESRYGNAVEGAITDNTNTNAAIFGHSVGSGPAVLGSHFGAGNGLSGVAGGTGSGVYGESREGRGGLFVGLKAQIRLRPSTAATHPSSGQAGDLFVDATKRLWFCKGGSTWALLG